MKVKNNKSQMPLDVVEHLSHINIINFLEYTRAASDDSELKMETNGTGNLVY